MKNLLGIILLCIFAHIYFVYYLGEMLYKTNPSKDWSAKYRVVIWIPIVNLVYIIGNEIIVWCKQYNKELKQISNGRNKQNSQEAG